MTRAEAQKHLLRYRPGTSDATDPEIAEALAFATQDTELAQWLEKHCEQQDILRSKIRRMPVPAGLKEQILSERPAAARNIFMQRNVLVASAFAMVLAIALALFFTNRAGNDDGFANYRRRMVSTALRGYGMDLESGDPAKIRLFLAQNKVMENYELPDRLRKAAASGCAIEHWQGANVAMICFRTGKPLPPPRRPTYGCSWLSALRSRTRLRAILPCSQRSTNCLP